MANVNYPKVDFQDIIYYQRPNQETTQQFR